MNNIRSYYDLLLQEKQLEELLQAQKELVIYDFGQLKEEFKPVAKTINLFSKIITRDKSNLLINGGINKLIDLVFKKLVLARSGWITKLLVPFFLKNYSSHIVADHKEQFIEKLFSWIGHKNGHDDAETENYETEKKFEPF